MNCGFAVANSVSIPSSGTMASCSTRKGPAVGPSTLPRFADLSPIPCLGRVSSNDDTNPIGSIGWSGFLRRGECGSRDGFDAMRVASGPAVLSPAERHPVPPARSKDRPQVPVQSESCLGQSRRYFLATQDRAPSIPGPILWRRSRSARRSPTRKVCYPHGPPGRVPRPAPGE